MLAPLVGCNLDTREPNLLTGDDAGTRSLPNQPGGSAGVGGAGVTLDADASVSEGGSSPELPIDPGCEGSDAGCVAPVDGQCSGADAGCDAACAGCLIDGDCVADGEPHPNNPCQGCDPGLDALGWSNVSGDCDDGAFCTLDDHCEAGECVGGGATACEDGAACNGISVCDEVDDSCSPPENQCGDLALCDVASDRCVSTCEGCIIDGSCVAPGFVEPGNPCRICDPARSSVAYSANATALCGSGPSACSAQDVCNAQGQCIPNHEPDLSTCGPGDARFCFAGDCVPCDEAPNPNAACAARDADAPLCDPSSGRCVACLPSSCGGDRPACDPDAGCLPCREHSQCPGTACHLSGPLEGSCFDTGDVVQVNTPAQLRTQIGILTPNRPSVIRLAGGTFTTTDFLDISGDGVEVAILGQPGTVLSGGPTNGIPFLVSVGFDATAYLSNLSFRDGPSSALGTSQGSVVWVDDVEISGYPNNGMVGTGEGHLRRSRIRGGSTDLLWQGGALFMENTALGAAGALVGLRTLNSPRIDVTYSTIAGAVESLNCNASPGPSGQIRNSILLGTAPPSIGGNACDLLAYSGNVVDAPGFGTVVTGFDRTWFVDAAAGDFHLTAAGVQAIAGVATRGAGDPGVDVDGQARPARGRPGVDQR